MSDFLKMTGRHNNVVLVPIDNIASINFVLDGAWVNLKTGRSIFVRDDPALICDAIGSAKRST